MRAFETTREMSLDHADDLPPPAARFNEYVERELYERTREAYERGLDRGSKCRLGVLLLGMMLGGLVGFGLGIIP